MNVASRDARPSLHRHIYRTPQGARAAVCDLYMADEGGVGGCKVVSTDLDQRLELKKKNTELIIVVEARRPYMSPHS